MADSMICEPDLCTGCMACYNVCKHKAIDMVEDSEGFVRPRVIESKCVDCSLCRKVCPINNAPLSYTPKEVYSGWAKDEELRMASSSGGAFSVLALPILQDGGIVIGCALDENLKAVHRVVEKVEDLSLLRGSKYVQSYIGDIYCTTKMYLLAGRRVLFCGTPCQIAGLRNYLHKKYDNLITVDLICHGVPSPKVFEDWKSYMKRRYALKSLLKINFRGKKSSWIFFHMGVNAHMEKGETFHYEGKYYEDPWIRGFLRDYFLRPSCHKCQFTKEERNSDFTIADWWGYKPLKEEPKDYEKKGVSLLMCNTGCAVNYYNNECASMFVSRKRNMNEAHKTNGSLSHPFPPSPYRAQFWNDYSILSFEDMVEKYMKKEKLSFSMHIRVSSSNRFVHLIARIISKIERTLNLTYKY